MENRVIVVGAGLAGLSCAIKLAEKNIFVDLVSLLPAKRSHSVCAQGGINAAISKEDSAFIHAYETIKGGDFLANQPAVIEMCLAAPSIIEMMDSFGCLFNRTKDGSIDFRNFGGSLYKRTAFSDASTGQQLIYSLDEQTRRYEEKKIITRYEHHEFLKLIKDENGSAKGIILQDINNLNIFSITADAVVIATGGLGVIFGKSTNSFACTGCANAALFMQGMKYANAEFIQIHPTAIPGHDKLRLISESARGEGARIWVYGDDAKTIEFPDGSFQKCGKKNEPWYFLEEMYPKYKNLVPRDIAAREILKVCNKGLGADNKDQVYLDVTHLNSESLKKLSSCLDIYEKFTSEDPRKIPMKTFLAVHYSMGGAWVDWPASDDSDRDKRFRQMTNIEGLFNIGESDYQYHGANRLGANALLACIYSGLVAGDEVNKYISSYKKLNTKLSIENQIKDEIKRQKKLLNQMGKENVFQLHNEMSDLMLKNVTVTRDNKSLKETLDKLREIEERSKNISLQDKSVQLNQSYLFAREFFYMVKLAQVITKSALLRNESRGSHYKKEFPKRDDLNFLKTTLATYNADKNDVDISYEKVDLRHFDPMQRSYEKEEFVPSIKNFKKFEPVL
ncbi:MAG: succinate dehydrogenase flavoprotein subunit [Parachlamydiales bacterium]|jgi:succinate dehydrogenase / fumarate reductase flavoprotein subunit